jgi:hypothetical protein
VDKNWKGLELDSGLSFWVCETGLAEVGRQGERQTVPPLMKVWLWPPRA